MGVFDSGGEEQNMVFGMYQITGVERLERFRLKPGHG